VIFNSHHKTGGWDLEALEMAVRAAMHHAGATALTEILRFPVPSDDDRRRPCSCGHQAHYRELRTKPVLTAVGPVQVSRPYYLCSHCQNGQFPADVELDIENVGLSPGVRRMLALVGQDAPFDHGREQMKQLADLEVTTKAVERTAEAIGQDILRIEKQHIEASLQLHLPLITGEPIPILYVQMDGTGVPVVQAETEGRAGRNPGQPARTREAKLGCVFTQTAWDEQGYAIRDPASTTYIGSIEPASDFGKRIYLEAWNRGLSRARQVVIIGDGAEWVRTVCTEQFPQAIQIVDLYHARQHLWEVARAVYPLDEVRQKRWILRHQPKLDGGDIAKLVAYLRSLNLPSTEAAEKVATEAAYFHRNADRMRYDEFRRQHLFVGSGVIEAGCKTVIGMRCKQSGMFWTVRGANAIIALRCCVLNNRFEDYWAERSQRAA
jgi:hypothetical protein